MVDCVLCGEPVSANKLPNNHKLYCHACKKTYSILDVVRIVENKPDLKEEEIYSLLKNLFGLTLETKNDKGDTEKLFKDYDKRNFDLTPVAKNNKNPIERDWPNKVHRDPEEWMQWIISGLNLGLKTGARSGVTVLDIDALTKSEKAEYLDSNCTAKRQKELIKLRDERVDIIFKKFNIELTTVYQKTLGGYHLIYKYEPDIPKCQIKVEGIIIDVENDGGQVVIPPSIIPKTERKIYLENEIQQMPQNIKTYCLEYKPPKSEVVKKDNGEPDLKSYNGEDFDLKDLEGMRNNTWIKMGGILRKELNPSQTSFVLKVMNRNLMSDPLEDREIDGMMGQLNKYVSFDEQELSRDIINYLEHYNPNPSKAEIEMAILGTRALGENKKRVDKTLKYLLKEEKIICNGRNFELVEEMEWTDRLVGACQPIDFQVPFMDDYAYFLKGQLMLIGSPSKRGKTTLAMNFVKRIVDQGIKPYYIYNENGSGFVKSAYALGLKDEDFYFPQTACFDPEKIRLRPNSIVIYDWINPRNFATTDKLYESICEKLEKTKSFMIAFTQLRQKDHEWFAPDLIVQYPALACKYLYAGKGGGSDTYFELTHVRDPKFKGKVVKIPCTYDWDTKIVTRIEDMPSGTK